MQRTNQTTLQQSNSKAYAACLKSVCDSMVGGGQKYKGQLSSLLNKPVQKIVGVEFTPQVLDELVEMPHHQIVALMQDDTQFNAMVNLAFYCVKGNQEAEGSDMCNTSMASTNESVSAAAQPATQPEAQT